MGAIANPTKYISAVEVQALQSVVPTTPTHPRITTTLHLPDALNLNRRYHLLLCYNSQDPNSGWRTAGWIKESLGMALQDYPLLAGRIRHSQLESFQVVSNDSGVRLVEANSHLKLDDLDQAHHADLLFWGDISITDLHFSPLCYVQVTNFACGGYSIGVTCSLLLMDPFGAISFVNKWADTHKSTLLKYSVSEHPPTFYFPSIAKPGVPCVLPMGPNLSKNPARSVIYEVRTKIANLDNVAKNLAAICIDKAEREMGAKMVQQFSLFVKGDSEADPRVEICSRDEVLENSDDVTNGLKCERALWDEQLRLESVCFNGDGKKPIVAKTWINSVISQGSVMIFSASTDDTKIIVTFT